jgi:hypothetical protein
LQFFVCILLAEGHLFLEICDSIYKMKEVKIMKKTLFLATFLCATFFNDVMAQDSNTVFTKDGKALEVRTTPNNTLIELNKADSIFKFNVAVANFDASLKTIEILRGVKNDIPIFRAIRRFRRRKNLLGRACFLIKNRIFLIQKHARP